MDFFSLEAASFAYPQHGLGLAPVSLSVPAGEAMVVEGPSGGGKSTLARCLVGLIPHLYHGQLGGAVRLDGLVTHETPLWQLTRRASLVFQNPATQMLAPTVHDELIFGLENLGLPAGVVRVRVAAAMAQFGLEALGERAPHTLSGGEQQKLALACMVARQTPALVLDEPLSMLDPTAASDLVAALAGEVGAGRTVVVCEHRAEYLAELPHRRTLWLGNGHHPAAAQAGAAPLPPLSPISPFELQVDGLCAALGGRPVLPGLDLTLPGGQIVALVGRNGAGKTTLLRALAGLQPNTGRVQVLQDGRALPPRLGIVLQNPDYQLFNATVRDEILYRVPNPDLDYYGWLCAALGLGAYEAVPPLLLSEGEKRRVALATVLMRRPAHGLLLDEPSLGQDRAHKVILQRTLRSLAAAGYLVILATHDLELAFQADSLLLLAEGRLIHAGPAAAARQAAGAWQQAGIRIPPWIACAP